MSAQHINLYTLATCIHSLWLRRRAHLQRTKLDLPNVVLRRIFSTLEQVINANNSPSVVPRSQWKKVVNPTNYVSLSLLVF